ncbi:ATP-binding protein [Nocardiopsis sp. MG754419]|uniref:sensor histidine kinase n=1 Tax=Nocardiopsis sp. MG754419 TaxID=2259865 RepID=UPI001BACE70F|nr:ATP-binding protein [Nocardiopsis sp. MG754419]MBR8745342.1 histidine kinase [Nocardiopsis sp. MG754419]
MPQEKRRSLRARMITLVLIPSTALLALWALFTTTLTLDIAHLRTTATLIQEVGTPTTDVIDHLQGERRATLAALDSPTERSADDLTAARAHTDRAIGTFVLALSAQNRDTLPDQALEFRSGLADLPTHRENVDALTTDADVLTEAAAPYTDLVDLGIRVWDSQVERADDALLPHLRSLTSLMRTRELLNQQDTILAHAVATNTFTPQAHAAFAAAVGAQRHTWSRVDAEAGDDTDAFALLDGSSQLETIELLQDTVIGTPVRGPRAGVPVHAQTWQGAAETLDTRIREVENERRSHVVALSRQHAADLRTGVLLLSVPTLLVALACAVVAVNGTQRLGRRLQELRTRTLDHARVRLPEVTARLRAGEEVDADTEVPRLGITHRDELGQVAAAFDDAQRAAVAAAVEEAQVRAGVRNMFRNIARRTQSLVHRQLDLLDRLERKETDPAVLESLFRIDHFSTQLRRNAENLMLLSGDRPHRRRDTTVGLHEAVRAAAGEIEDYTRVRVRSVPSVSLRGEAGADLVRLLAELLENATAFSPPDTDVTVEAARDGDRYRVRVRDTGLGMGPERLEAANTLLADPPGFDLARTREDSQLGLYVVATIAARHGFTVFLSAEPFQGTEATVLVPEHVLSIEPSPADAALDPATPPSSDDGVTTTREPRAVDGGRPSAREGGPRPSPAVEGDTHMGLPRRRRRAPEPASPTSPEGESPCEPRSLAQVKSMMSAFQAGTERGRAAATQDTPPAPRPGGRAEHDHDTEG